MKAQPGPLHRYISATSASPLRPAHIAITYSPSEYLTTRPPAGLLVCLAARLFLPAYDSGRMSCVPRRRGKDRSSRRCCRPRRLCPDRHRHQVRLMVPSREGTGFPCMHTAHAMPCCGRGGAQLWGRRILAGCIQPVGRDGIFRSRSMSYSVVVKYTGVLPGLLPRRQGLEERIGTNSTKRGWW